MKNKYRILYTILLTGLLMFVGISEVSASEYKSYNVGDEIKVKLNDSTSDVFYVTENSDATKETVTAIYKGALGDEVELAAGMSKDLCNFENSNIYTELNNRTSNWKNVSSKTLPTASQILGVSFDETNRDEFENLSVNTYNGSTTSLPLTNVSTAPFYAKNINQSYWGSSFSIGVTTNPSYNPDYPCLPYEYGQYLLNEGTYLINSYEGLSSYIRPIIVVSKDFIFVSEEEKTSTPTVNSNSKKGTQTVQVANTAANFSIIIIGIALLLICVGTFAVYKAVKNKKTEI